MSSQFSIFLILILVMRLHGIIFIILMLIVSVVVQAKDVNDSILLRCIAEVESNNVSSRIGEQGERSRYQIMPKTWVMYSRIPFGLIGQEKYQSDVDKVAIQHLRFIKVSIVRKGHVVSVYNIALCWNGGSSRSSYSKNTKDYAERVQNLYNELSDGR